MKKFARVSKNIAKITLAIVLEGLSVPLVGILADLAMPFAAAALGFKAARTGSVFYALTAGTLFVGTIPLAMASFSLMDMSGGELDTEIKDAFTDIADTLRGKEKEPQRKQPEIDRHQDGFVHDNDDRSPFTYEDEDYHFSDDPVAMSGQSQCDSCRSDDEKPVETHDQGRKKDTPNVNDMEW